MLPWAEEVVKNRQSKEDPEANCLPSGIPRGSPYPWRIVQTPTHYFILFEGNIHSFRQIFMNGKHPDDPDPTWYGHSIGHWEGNTLVVDTVGFNDKFWFDYKGHPHTEKLHTIERYTRTDLGHMSIEVTIDDPGAYTKPFTTVGRATLMPGQNSWSTSARRTTRTSKKPRVRRAGPEAKQTFETVLALFDAINRHDPDALAALMTQDHVFIDGLGNSVHGRETMRAGWRAISRCVRITGCPMKTSCTAATSSRRSEPPVAPSTKTGGKRRPPSSCMPA